MANRRPGFEEIVVRVGGQSLTALVNGAYGWLMYLPSPGAAGMSSRNPRYNGPPSAMIEYYLNNGQRDEYPASWALPIATVRRAIEYFRSNEAIPPFIDWHAD